MTALGLDVAGVDSNTHIDWAKAHAAGVRFAYLKKSQGLHVESFYSQEVQRARDAGLVVGAYLFPTCTAGSASPHDQVKAFKSGAGDIIPSKDLPPCLDVEYPTGVAAQGRTRSELVELIREFVLEFEDQLQVTPCIYTAYTQYDDLGCPAMPWASKCPLFVKTAYRLNARQPVDQVAPHDPHIGLDAFHDPKDFYRIPDPWNDTGWWIQQYQGDALGMPGFNATVDVDLFHTTRLKDRGAHVKWLQAKLSVPVTGTFDQATDVAVRNIQAKHGLVVDSVIGPATFSAIAWI